MFQRNSLESADDKTSDQMTVKKDNKIGDHECSFHFENSNVNSSEKLIENENARNNDTNGRHVESNDVKVNLEMFQCDLLECIIGSTKGKTTVDGIKKDGGFNVDPADVNSDKFIENMEVQNEDSAVIESKNVIFIKQEYSDPNFNSDDEDKMDKAIGSRAEENINTTLIKQEEFEDDNIDADSVDRVYEFMKIEIGEDKILNRESSVKAATPNSQMSLRDLLLRNDNKSYKCNVCYRSFNQLHSLTKHKDLHNCEKRYQCDVCKLSFNELGNLKKHKFVHADEKPYRCEICSRSFSQLYSLNRHKLLHTGEKPYQCDVCNKCFNELSNLKKHKLVHTDEKPYQCNVCSKSFSQSYALNRHKLLHTSERPYQCEICNKCFDQLDHLKSHQLLHADKRNQCDICKRSFGQSSQLYSHKLIHSDKKPYRCDICKKCFKQPGALKRHKLTHTNEKPYPCDVCNKGFKDLTTCKRHKMVHTRESNTDREDVEVKEAEEFVGQEDQKNKIIDNSEIVSEVVEPKEANCKIVSPSNIAVSQAFKTGILWAERQPNIEQSDLEVLRRIYNVVACMAEREKFEL